MKPAGGVNKRRAQADLLLKIGAIIFIFGIFFPIFFVAGGVIFGAGAVIWLMYRHWFHDTDSGVSGKIRFLMESVFLQQTLPENFDREKMLSVRLPIIG
jgi:hypothetical protein